MSLFGIDGATSAQGSQQTSNNYGYNIASGTSGTDAASARAFSAQQAALAYERQQQLNEAQMQFNREEAAKQRAWETEMANSIYTRSVKNMREAGINPILAANMGLSAASVGSGATASISGSSAPMAQSFMDSWSAQSSKGENYGNSQGSSWGQSESGLAVGLQMMGEAIAKAIGTMNSGNTINYMMDGLGGAAKTTWNDLKQLMVKNLPNEVSKMLGLNYDASSKSGGAPKRKKTVTGKGTIQSDHSGGGAKF